MIILLIIQAIIIGAAVHFKRYTAAATAFSFMLFIQLLIIIEKLNR